jgi:hypothetical protein
MTLARRRQRPGQATIPFDLSVAILRNRGGWAVFATWEEFIAGLDPYLKPIPTRFDKSRRYRLELLSPKAAAQAMQRPARQAGVAFTDAAAARLVDDLCSIHKRIDSLKSTSSWHNPAAGQSTRATGDATKETP